MKYSKKVLIIKDRLNLSPKELGEFITKKHLSITDVANYASSIPDQENSLKLYEAIQTLPFPPRIQGDIISITNRYNYLAAVNNSAYYISNEGDYKRAFELVKPYLPYVKEYIYLAHMAADLYGYFGNAAEALKYVRIAAENNYPNMELMEKSEDLKLLRNDKKFQEIFRQWRESIAEDDDDN